LTTVSTNHDFSQELGIAETAAREAGRIVMGLFGKDYRIEEKSKGNPVTTADLEANRTIREIVRGRYPGDGWLSEEDADNLDRLSASRVWVVDPIDGTKEFIEGVPQFAVSIGLVVEGRPMVGVVYNPATDRLFRAAKGHGAMLNDQPIHVSTREQIEGAFVLVSRSEPKRKFESFAGLCKLEPTGSIAYRLAQVAGGEGDATLTFRSIREWDVCAAVLIVEEAGGVVIDGGGKRLVFNQQEARYRGVVASNGTLAKSLQRMVAQVLSEKR
jgi:myo-inositol-1(or 4)-monophosphatase